jgi:hypothetical protein
VKFKKNDEFENEYQIKSNPNRRNKIVEIKKNDEFEKEDKIKSKEQNCEN